MANKNKEGEPFSTVGDIYARLQGIGYQLTTVSGIPDGLTVFMAPLHSSDLRRLGTTTPRSYALYPLNDDGTEYVIGWSHPVLKKKGELMNTGDPTKLAAQNCLGRLTFLESCPGIRGPYLRKIVGKFTDSILAQSQTRPENS